MKSNVLASMLFAGAALWTACAAAQSDPNLTSAAPSTTGTAHATLDGAPADVYGTGQGSKFIAATKFAGPVGATSPQLVYEAWNFFRSPGSVTPVRYFAHVDDIPNGANIQHFACFYRDTSAANDVTFTLQYAEQTYSGTPTRTNNIMTSAASSGTPGLGVVFLFPPSPLTNMNYLGGNTVRQYYVTADIADDTSTPGCIAFYNLQISPAPGVASFTDVPTGHPFFQVIEALKASGITAGCTANTYCPDAPVTRAAMAAFLARALGLFFPY